jgi:hypothetical protein
VTTVTANDNDSGQTLSFNIVGGVDAAHFAINAEVEAWRSTGAPRLRPPKPRKNPRTVGALFELYWESAD